jgi:hypothetical protein
MDLLIAAPINPVLGRGHSDEERNFGAAKKL